MILHLVIIDAIVTLNGPFMHHPTSNVAELKWFLQSDAGLLVKVLISESGLCTFVFL